MMKIMAEKNLLSGLVEKAQEKKKNRGGQNNNNQERK
jgi:hypothetical protein